MVAYRELSMSKKLALNVVIFATTAWAQDNLSPQMQAGCSPDRANFAVQRQTRSHPTGTPESGKALASCVTLETGPEPTSPAILLAGPDLRAWVLDRLRVRIYANHRPIRIFPRNPEGHRLCTSQQSSLKSRRDDNASAITFTAEEGKVYYFRTQPTPTSLARSATSQVLNGEVELATVNPAQAQLMVPKWAYSTSQPKK